MINTLIPTRVSLLCSALPNAPSLLGLCAPTPTATDRRRQRRRRQSPPAPPSPTSSPSLLTVIPRASSASPRSAMATATSSWPRLGLALSFLISSAVSAAANETNQAKESMIYPEPHPEAFRSLSLALSLLGSSIAARPPASLPPVSPTAPGPLLISLKIFLIFLILIGSSVLAFCVARRTAGLQPGGQFSAPLTPTLTHTSHSNSQPTTSCRNLNG